MNWVLFHVKHVYLSGLRYEIECSLKIQVSLTRPGMGFGSAVADKFQIESMESPIHYGRRKANVQWMFCDLRHARHGKYTKAFLDSMGIVTHHCNKQNTDLHITYRNGGLPLLRKN